ncbi:chromatin modification-related protein eaf6-like isoform X2 [Solanum tuberosum]|uniref:chromatin modification-related protein eaf6-like isoform X2 n=1 Tax=Solanum tuberosum TaxID=4113 RepID=UPI00073A3E5B|nr:PREDICTED: chromatin modification-related protein eaf6-like isoform X2 [Solanum tuberosum]
MEAEGQRTSSNPSAVLAALLSKRAKLHEDLRNLEKQDPSQCGNVLKGFEGFLSSSKSTSFLKRSRKFQPEDRLFSLSSVTSPAAEEQALGRDGGGISANVQGRQRKGRGGPRDAKRMRHSSEPDYDYEDDPDLM